jgi:exosortase H (IPTLxxWG-CTERM-specific)
MKRFFVVFLAVQMLLFGLELMNPVQTHVVLPWTTFLAQLCAAAMKVWDSQVVSTGKVLMNPLTGFGVSVEPGCNGVEACIVLFAAIVAFPSGLKSKLVGLAWGLIAVQGLNMVRVISLYYLGQWDKAWFNFAHEYLWQGLIMLDVLVVFLIWVNHLPRPEKPKNDDVSPNLTAQAV